MKGPGKSESEDAAQDVIDAIASKDAKALDLALKRHSLCSHDDEDEEDDEDYDSEEA